MRWKSGPLARSNDILVSRDHGLFSLAGFEWLCKHNRLRPEPIRFVRLDSEHAQSDGKSVNRGLPELDQVGPSQRFARGRDPHR